MQYTVPANFIRNDAAIPANFIRNDAVIPANFIRNDAAIPAKYDLRIFVQCNSYGLKVMYIFTFALRVAERNVC